MTDERNIAHDKKVADDKRANATDDASHDAVQPQPGRKPPQVDADTDPANSRAAEWYRQGSAPRDHSHESTGNPDEVAASEIPPHAGAPGDADTR